MESSILLICVYTETMFRYIRSDRRNGRKSPVSIPEAAMICSAEYRILPLTVIMSTRIVKTITTQINTAQTTAQIKKVSSRCAACRVLRRRLVLCKLRSRLISSCTEKAGPCCPLSFLPFCNSDTVRPPVI